jgi:predicted Zn-dependent protease with MMP-like domain
MNRRERHRFDALVEQVIGALPEAIARLLEEVPVVVEDLPDESILREFGMTPDQADELCGLHTGTANTEASVEQTDLPSQIMLFRIGILAQAGGWEAGEAAVLEEIRITLLHEIGHQFGLDEEDLRQLGYE